MGTEYFDIMDCRGRKTGEVMSRDEAHRTGTWHGAFHCLIVYKRGGRGYALFQKRAMGKAIAPGKYDVSVGGHYSSGEDAAVAGPREIKEELGLAVKFPDLVPVGRRIFVYCFTPGTTECEFQDVFLFERGVGPEGLVLQQEELDGVIELGLDEGSELFSGRKPVVDAPFFSSTGNRSRVPLAAADFVPCLDNYYHKLLLLAQRYLRGERGNLLI